MKRCLFFLVLMINGICLLSQSSVKRDTVYIEPRAFNTRELEALKGQKDFQYDKLREPDLSLWDKFWNWVWWKVGQLLNISGGITTVWTMLIILGIIVIIAFVFKVTGMDQGGLFGRSSKYGQQYTLSQNDIHDISFDDEIEKAISDGNFRLAIRLQYLQALKKLADKGDIDWRINKTNSDYLIETTGKLYNDRFRNLTRTFEYFWYGEKKVDNEKFSIIRSEFQQFNNQLQ